jgi:hypothetical protein
MSPSSGRLKALIESNAQEIVKLNARIRETFAHRNRSPEHWREWKRACESFHSRYNELSFPGGLEGAVERLLAGDQDTMEATICFLEVRPYFFRSGYMFESLFRKARHAPLSTEQRTRLEQVAQARAAWRATKAAAKS